MARPNQVADINERREARGLPALTRQRMVQWIYESYGEGEWPPNWAGQLIAASVQAARLDR